jgi:lysophospholipase L1-like esterase
MKPLIACLSLSLLSAFTHAQDSARAAADSKAFTFKDGDRIVLLGSTVIEREQRYGHFETALALALSDKAVSVRNLAWSGDTVFGDARSYFGPPAEGLERLAAHLEMLKPTVVLACYGADLAHEGLKNLPAFLTGYRALLDEVREKSPGVRIILMPPTPLETLPAPLPNQSAANKNLALLRDALAKFAASQNAFFIDAFEAMGGVPHQGIAEHPLTENGIHYTEEGYRILAGKIVAALGLKPLAIAPVNSDALRRAIVAKDTLFFNRWRPQNETYLFGFRKHEQGQNAKEIPMFDPLIETADKHVQELKATALASVKQP